ncbi:MAG: hypothetical protein ACPIOQ_52950 [Promethearchaeia archaeon]
MSVHSPGIRECARPNGRSCQPAPELVCVMVIDMCKYGCVPANVHTNDGSLEMSQCPERAPSALSFGSGGWLDA